MRTHCPSSRGSTNATQTSLRHLDFVYVENLWQVGRALPSTGSQATDIPVSSLSPILLSFYLRSIGRGGYSYAPNYSYESLVM
jgi:hypothetical protein